MSSLKRFSPSNISLSSFALTHGLADYETMSTDSTEKGFKSSSSSQGTPLSSATGNGCLHDEVGIRCRIQWLGGTSQFLVPFIPESKGSKLVVTQVKDGRYPPSSEWILNWRDSGSVCTIRSALHDTGFVSGAQLSGTATLVNLCRMHPPLDSAGGNTCNDVQEEWTCLITFSNSTKLAVPAGGVGSLVTLIPRTTPVTKCDIWRIQLLKEVVRGTSNETTTMPVLLDNLLPHIPLSEPWATVSKGMRCWLFAYKSGEKACIQVDSDDSLIARANIMLHPAEWIITPRGDLFTIQLAENAKYLSDGPPIGLSRTPTKWAIKKFGKSPVSGSRDVRKQWVCTIHPAQGNTLLMLSKTPPVFSHLPNKLKGKHMCCIQFLGDKEFAENSKPQARHKTVENRIAGMPISTSTTNNSSVRLYCRISCDMVTRPMYLALSTSDQDDSGLCLVAHNPPEWILSLEGEEYQVFPSYTIKAASNFKTLSALKKFIPPWEDSAYKRPSNVIDSFLCELRPASSGGGALTGLCAHKRGRANYTGVVATSYGTQTPYWRVEILRKENMICDSTKNEGPSAPHSAVDQVNMLPLSGSSTVRSNTFPIIELPDYPELPTPKTELTPTEELSSLGLPYIDRNLGPEGDLAQNEGSSITLRVKASCCLPLPTVDSQASKQVQSLPSKENDAQSKNTPIQVPEHEPAEQGPHNSAASTQSARKCRIEHILSGMYLTSQACDAGLTDFSNAETWMIQSMGPGYNIMTRILDRVLYLAPIYDNSSGTIELGYSAYPAAWDISQWREQRIFNFGAEDIDWICKLRWPFTGQLILAESAANYPVKLDIDDKSHYVWLSQEPEKDELRGLKECWRIRFLV